LEYATAAGNVVGKLAAALFEQALAITGAAAGDAVMVGDDVESARAASCRPRRLTRSPTCPRCRTALAANQWLWRSVWGGR